MRKKWPFLLSLFIPFVLFLTPLFADFVSINSSSSQKTQTTPLKEMSPSSIAEETSFLEKKEDSSFIPLSTAQVTVKREKSSSTSIDLRKAFFASPIIYSLLLVFSFIATSLWFYTLFSFRSKKVLAPKLIEELHIHLVKKNYDTFLIDYPKKIPLLAQILNAGILTRKHGASFMTEAMKAEGKRATTSLWQRITFLNDIVLLSPMLGLLGTVIGIFYAFYDVNRSTESVITVFDGLGIAIGTTVAGLIVATLSMLFSMTLKYRITQTLTQVEKQAFSLSHFIDPF